MSVHPTETIDHGPAIDYDQDHRYKPGDDVSITIANRNDFVSIVTVVSTVGDQAENVIVSPEDSAFIETEVQLPIEVLIDQPVVRNGETYSLAE